MIRRVKARSLLFVLAALLLLATPLVNAANAQTYDAKTVSFHSAAYPPTPFQIRRAKAKGVPLAKPVGVGLKGRLIVPSDNGPFPAIVLMHGCNGPGKWNEVWSKRLVSWGYIVLDVDSFASRKFANVCGRETLVAGPTRALDAYGARGFLSGLPSVAKGRVAVMGMSHGGWAALNAINKATTERLGARPFKAAVGLYPWCDGPTEIDAALLILIGERDTWTPLKRCKTFIKQLKTTHPLEIKSYADVHHMFDLDGVDRNQLGHVLRHHPASAADAFDRVRTFLGRHL